MGCAASVLPCLHCCAQTIPGSLGEHEGVGILEERCTEVVALGGVDNRRFLIKPEVVADGDMVMGAGSVAAMCGFVEEPCKKERVVGWWGWEEMILKLKGTEGRR